MHTLFRNRVNRLEILNRIFVAKPPLHLEIHRPRLLLLTQVEAESINRKNRHLLGSVADPKFGNQIAIVVIKFVEFYLVLGQAGPEPNIDHHIPESKIHILLTNTIKNYHRAPNYENAG